MWRELQALVGQHSDIDGGDQQHINAPPKASAHRHMRAVSRNK
jgi:hypothetical protein